MAGSENRIVSFGFGRQSHWQGRSGRAYDLISENLDHFAKGDAELYLIAKGSHVLWVGSTSELVGDPLSRSRFRLALDHGHEERRDSERSDDRENDERARSGYGPHPPGHGLASAVNMALLLSRRAAGRLRSSSLHGCRSPTILADAASLKRGICLQTV